MAGKKQERVNVDLMTITGLGKALAAVGAKGASKAKAKVSKMVAKVVKSSNKSVDKGSVKKTPVVRKSKKAAPNTVGGKPGKGKPGKKP